jgi:O-succinylbenzoate synthase
VLLPPGEAALAAWPQHWALGHRTFKTKIGIAPVADELQWLTLLINQLPLGGKLRLDANGGLDELSAHRWLDWCDRINPIGASHEGQRIEYLEQPLPPAQFLALLRLSQRYQTPIALDESVSTLEQLKAHYYRGWRSLYVIKAAIIGSPSRLKQFCQHYPIDFVISSVFETVIGRQAAIDLAADLATSASQRALGLGTQQWFDDLNQSDGAALWQQL